MRVRAAYAMFERFGGRAYRRRRMMFAEQRRYFQGFEGFGGFPQGGGGQQHTEYYDRLGVSSDATEDEIKKAFRKKAMEHHPDRGGDIEKFKEIKAAYEILSDEQKRQQYDQFGPDGVQDENGQPGGQPGAGGFNEDIFSQFFGGRQGAANRAPRKTETMHSRAELTLEEIFSGVTKELRFNKQEICNTCDGLGASSKKGVKHCRACNGTGVVTQTRQMGPFMQQVQSECMSCGGQGKTIDPAYKCGTCDGKKVVRKKKTLEVKIRPGTKQGTKLYLRGQADQHPDMEPGDIILTIAQKKHPTFSCAGNDLVYKHKLTLAEALTGYKVPLKNVDGKTLVLENDEGKVVQSGMLQVISGAGMPRGSGSDVSKIPRGDLYVMFDVEMPQSLKSEDIEKLKEIFGETKTEEVPDDAVKTAPKNAGRVPFRLDVDIDDDDDSEDWNDGGAQASQCRQM